MATLDSVIENINSFNNTGQLSQALESVSDSLETGTGVTALGEISELIKTQGNMSVKELKRSREDLTSLKDKVLTSDRIAEKDRSNILTLIQNQEDVINQNTTLSKRAAEFVQENIKEKIPDIAGVAAGVLSESPAAALGVKFIGDKIQESRERKRKEREERAARLQRIADEEDRHNRELEVLRGQITNEETLSKVNMTQQEAADIAKQNGMDYQDYINDLKNQLIEQSKLQKQQKDVQEAKLKETEELKDKFGFDQSGAPVTESPIGPGNPSTPSEPLETLSDGGGEPYLAEIRDLLKFMSSPDTVTPFDIENSREERRFQKDLAAKEEAVIEQLEVQTDLLEKIHKEQNDDLKENIIANMAGSIGGKLGGLASMIGGSVAGALGLGGLGGALGLGGKSAKAGQTAGRAAKAGKLGRLAKIGRIAKTGGIAALGATAASALVGGATKLGKTVVGAGSALMGGVKRVAGSVGEMAGRATTNLGESIGKVASSATGIAKATPEPKALTNVADAITKTGPDMIDGKIASPKVTPTPKVSTPPKLPKAAGALDTAKGALKSVTAPVVKLKDGAAKSVAGALDKTIAKKILASKGAKLLAKAIPGIGMAAGGLFALNSLFKGDFVGAAAEAGGIFLPSVAGAPLDAGIMARETYNQMFGSEDNPFPLEGDMIKQPDVAKSRMKQLKDMALEVIGVGQEELDKQGKIQALQKEITDAEDRITRSTGGENVYYGRDSKGIEKDQASIAAKQAEINSLSVSSGETSTSPDLSGGSATEQMSMNSERANLNQEMNNMMKQEAITRNTPANTGGTANVVNAPQQNINASKTTIVQQPHVRNPDPSIGFAQRGLQGAV